MKIKKTGFIILLISMINSVYASDLSSLTIRFSELGNYIVILNNVKYSAENVFQINGLNAGVMHLRIVKQTFNPYLEDMNKNEVFNDILEIKAGTKIISTLRRNGEFMINRIVPYKEESMDHGKIDDDDNFLAQSMSHSQFNKLKKRVLRISSSFGKLNVMKQTISLYGASSFQVKELMLILPFEKERLSLAIYSHSYLKDKEVSFILQSSFKYLPTRSKYQSEIKRINKMSV